jgi:hypothetical protein
MKDLHGHIITYNPERNLTRCQFTEMLFKLAIEKRSKLLYRRFDPKLVKPGFHLESIQEFFMDHADEYLKRFQSQPWRDEFFFTERVEMTLIKHHKILRKIYQYYSKPAYISRKLSLSMDDFIELIKKSGITEEVGQ